MDKNAKLSKSFLFFRPICFSGVVDWRIRFRYNRNRYELPIRLVVNHDCSGHNRVSVSIKFNVNENQTLQRDTLKTV